MLEILKGRFFKNKQLHPDVKWDDVEARLLNNPWVLDVLKRMEETGGEVDTIGYEKDTGKLIYCDCSIETPSGRRGLCYDEEALEKRKNNPPKGSAISMAKEIGASLMTEELYYQLQQLGEFDLKTSSWVKTPCDIRNKGGAIFCERRYSRVFTFHNGADSYYSVRGFRCYILI